MDPALRCPQLLQNWRFIDALLKGLSIIAGVCPLAVAYFVTEDSVDKFSHLEELINSRTPHTVGHISRTVEPQAAKIGCESTSGVVQACVIFYTQAAFL